MRTFRSILIALLIGAAIGIIIGIVTSHEREQTDQETAQEPAESVSETASSQSAVSEAPITEEEAREELEEAAEDKTTQASDVDLLDVAQETYSYIHNSEYPRNDYKRDAFQEINGFRQYTDTEHYTSRIGIDVSEFNGEIDWEEVKKAGFTFAFVRLGYRGYEGGSLFTDDFFEENLEGARAAGLDVGVYFFSQAVSEEEAEEEAAFVLEQLDGRDLQLPVIFDPEAISFAEARTDETTGKQFSKHALLFCEKIEEAGYEAGYYANLKWLVFMMDMGILKDYTVWYAGYENTLSNPYAFSFWQYSDEGVVPGITELTDLDIQLIPVG